MALNSTVSLTDLSPYSADIVALKRRQQLADLLQQQGAAPVQTFSYNGIQAHTPVTANISKIAQMLLSTYMSQKNTEDEKALGQKAQGDASDWISKLTANNPEVAGSVPAGAADVADREQGMALGSGAPAMTAGQPISVPGGQGMGANVGSPAGPISGPQRMALLLQGMQNPLTASASQNMLANEDTFGRQKALQEAQFGQQKAMQGQSEAFQAAQAELQRAQQEAMQSNTFENQAALQKAQQDFQAAQTKSGQEFQRSMGTPIMVPDQTSPTGFKYVRPEQAVGMPGYNKDAMFMPIGTMPSAAPSPAGPPTAAPVAPGAPPPNVAPGQQGGGMPAPQAAPTAPAGAPPPTSGVPPYLMPGQLDMVPTEGTGPQLPTQSTTARPDFLKTLNPQLASTVKGIAEGRIQVSPQMVRTPQGIQLLAAVSQYDPSFNASDFTNRAALRKNMTSGVYSQQLNALNTAIEHGGELADAAQALNNGNSSIKNAMANTVGPLIPGASGQDLKGRLNQFQINKNAFAEELEKAYRGAGGSEKEIEAWKNALSDSDSPQAINASIQKGLRLLNGKLDAISQTYNAGMGTAANGLQFLSPKAAATYARLAGPQSGAAPIGNAGTPKVIDWNSLPGGR